MFDTIQENLIDEKCSLSSILLKFRLFASKLGSELLEDWITYESDGYPAEVNIPEYRKIVVTYNGTFSGPFGSGIQNAPIPPAAIAVHAGEEYLNKEIRHSVAGIEHLIRDYGANGSLKIDGGNLMLLLNHKVYPEFSCIDIKGNVSTMHLLEAMNTVRTKLLDLTIKIASSYPQATEIELGSTKNSVADKIGKGVSEMAQNIIYGSQTIINNSGKNNTFNLKIDAGDLSQFTKYLTENGIDKNDAEELSEIVKNEVPENGVEPFGQKAKEWLGKNIGKSFTGAWKASGAVATTLITEALKKYYGFD